jgi:hypothetical protein
MAKQAGASQEAKPRRPRARTCPKCASKEVAPIMYGYPADMDAAMKAVDAGEVSLGGCVIEEDAPAWRCRSCHNGWGRLSQ